MNAADAIAECVARGAWSRDECEAYVASQMVGGVYCDGEIVIDASGRRCVPRAVVERKQAAAIPPKPSVTQTTVDAPSPSKVIVLGVAIALIVGVVLAER